MKKQTELQAKLEAFLEQSSSSKCGTCKLPNAEEINECLRKFDELKTAGTTTHDWRTIHAHFLQRELNYPLNLRSMRAHMRDCLGL